MASFGHVAIGLACGRAYSVDPASVKRAALAFVVISLLPDADALGFLIGIPYNHSLGHRGATHSILFALFVGLASYVYASRRKLRTNRTAAFATVVALSHPLLDTMTYGGGLGCALLWPFSDERFWAPIRFIPVAPIGLAILSDRGVQVVCTEVLMFAPFWLYAIWPRRKPIAS
jgi:inner membrane protein